MNKFSKFEMIISFTQFGENFSLGIFTCNFIILSRNSFQFVPRQKSNNNKTSYILYFADFFKAAIVHFLELKLKKHYISLRFVRYHFGKYVFCLFVDFLLFCLFSVKFQLYTNKKVKIQAKNKKNMLSCMITLSQVQIYKLAEKVCTLADRKT